MAGGRGEEVALLRRLLLRREGRVVGGDVGERAVGQRLPQRRAVGLVPDRRVDPGADAGAGDVLFREVEVMRAGFGGEVRGAPEAAEDLHRQGRRHMRDVQPRARDHVHGEERCHRRCLRLWRAGEPVRPRVGLVERGGAGGGGGHHLLVLGVHEDGEARLRGKPEHRHLRVGIGPREAGELAVAVRGRGGREDLERDDACVAEGVEGRLRQLHGCGEQREIGERVRREVVAADRHPLGRVAAGVGDRHLEERRDPALGRRPGLGFDASPRWGRRGCGCGVWMSIAPGSTWRPWASTVSRASGSAPGGRIATIRPPATATVPGRRPSGVSTCPPRMARSSVT